MNEAHQAFIDYLQRLAGTNRGALAELRRSLTFAPGAAPRVFPYVEPFIAAEEHPDSARRLARYLVAGLFALHPEHQLISLGKAMGMLYRKLEQSPSVENRFIALLESDGETLAEPLRHCITLLKSHDLALDYRALLADLIIWLNPARQDDLDRVRRRWASDFYRSSITAIESDK